MLAAKSLQSCPTLSCPWDSPGKNTGLGCHFLLQCMKVKSEREVAQSCPTLSDPMDCSPPGSSAHGIFQARVLEWGAIAFSTPYACDCIKRFPYITSPNLHNTFPTHRKPTTHWVNLTFKFMTTHLKQALSAA